MKFISFYQKRFKPQVRRQQLIYTWDLTSIVEYLIFVNMAVVIVNVELEYFTIIGYFKENYNNNCNYLRTNTI